MDSVGEELEVLRAAVRAMVTVADGLLAPALTGGLDDCQRAAVERALVDPNPPLRVVDLVNLGTYCPTQWEAYEADTLRPVFIRFRHGWLTVERFRHTRGVTGDWEVARGFATLYNKQVSDEYDGVMSTEDMLAHTGIIVS